MPTSSSNVWEKGFSENPAGEVLHADTFRELLERIGDEMVAPPGASADAGGPIMTRRELLLRVLWTRATRDADNTAMKLLIEYLDGKPGAAEAASSSGPAFTAEDMALAEEELRKELGDDHDSVRDLTGFRKPVRSASKGAG